jgi:predicted nucleic acid-binding protein
VIYLDTSMLLAELFVEAKRPKAELWHADTLVSSQLLEVEVWCALYRRSRARDYGAAATNLLDRVYLIDLTSEILARAQQPLPLPLRALDAIHIATLAEFSGQSCAIATYDKEMAECAVALGFPLATA